MVGVDTNVFLRWIVADAANEAERTAIRNALGDDRFHVSRVALIETFWVLRARYGFSQQRLRAALATILADEQIAIEDRPLVVSALRDWQEHGGDFADHVIARENRAAGCEHTFTFDRRAARSPHFVLLAET